jgi:cell shape-determining protein MreC
VFPAGYPVGRVLEVRLRPDQSFAEIIAEPTSALDREREVLLVWEAVDDAESDAEEAAAASVADGQ